MSSYEPHASSAAAPQAAASFANFGGYFSRAFQALAQRWRDWVGPMLVAAAIFLVAFGCCFFPVILVAGPLSCGLYACALRTLRGQHMDTGTLHRGWDRLGTSMLASVVIWLLNALPWILIYLIFIVGMFFLAAVGAATDSGGPGQLGGPGAAAVVIPEQFGLILAHTHHHGGGDLPGVVIVLMLLLYGLLFAGIGLSMVWSFWINTRTMFIIPLIADRDISFSEAWRLSWQETRRGFWELLVFQFLAGLIGGLGAYVCYVGILATLPICFTLIAAAYEHRFAPLASPAAADRPGDV